MRLITFFLFNLLFANMKIILDYWNNNDKKNHILIY